MSARQYTSRRSAIVDALVSKIKEIDGTSDFNTNLGNNVHPRLLFWEDVNEYPAVFITAGRETREYQAGRYKDRYLSVTIRCYVNSEESILALEGLLADIEFVIENNGRLAYQDSLGTQHTHDIVIESIDTDEGVLAPLGVGEILLQVHY